MALKPNFFLGFLLLFQLVASEASDHSPSSPIPVLQRSNFRSNFTFGSSSSAYQYEGAAFSYGKGKSNWDTYTHHYSERIAGKGNGDIAVDEYHRYKEDVAIMSRIGFNAYRFSISSPRILPSKLGFKSAAL